MPDRFRLRFRNELIGVAGEIVCGGLAPTADLVTDIARKIVPKEHLDDFVRMAIQDLGNLHEGNFGRLRLRASEYQAWRARYPPKEIGAR
jgi:hypothetical protein